MATNIHFPSDNSLLVDGVKVISRLLLQAKNLILASNINFHTKVFRNRNRTARRISRRIDELSKTRNQSGRQKRESAYDQLVKVARSSCQQAETVVKILSNLGSLSSQILLQKFAIYLPLIQQVIEQTSRRVFQQEKVPSSEKIVSIFESHTDIICRGKINLDVEFGHKIWLDEVDGGIISNYRILRGNPHDTQLLIPSLDKHVENFGSPPQIVTSDRGVYSTANEDYALKLGIKEVVLPKGGYRNQERIEHERKRKFVKSRHWHNGVEGRISYLKRCFGFQRCLYRGESGFSSWVVWGVIAHNLTIISRELKQKLS